MAESVRSRSAGPQLVGRMLIYALLILFALYYLMPLFVMVTTSLKTWTRSAAATCCRCRKRSRFDAWVKAWGTACTGVDCDGLKGYFMNSVSFVVPAVVISTLIGAFNGYVLTMWRFRGSDVLFTHAAVRLLHSVPGGAAADGADARLARHRQLDRRA